MLERIAVVGASLAGLRAVETLRRRGFDGELTWIGAERELPYDRPPLSKEILRGEWEAERARLAPEIPYADLELDLRLGCRATSLDPAQRTLELEGPETLGFDGLVIATGARPRSLRSARGLAGIHTLRSLDEARAIARELERSPRVCIVGAGFIGLEVAASCRARGLQVHVLEQLQVPLEGVLGRELGDHLAGVHRDHGVDLRCDVTVETFEGSRRVEGVKLADGTRLGCDLVIVGVGVTPETEWLASSGLELSDGVVCDESCAAGPGIVAAGDVARWHNPLFGMQMRVEHWMNASEQGAAAAERLLAGPEGARPFLHVPFFWSDQYDLKLQFAGLRPPDAETRVVDGTLEEGRFVVLYERAGRLLGALGVNRASRVVRYRQQIADPAHLDSTLASATE
ncbi:MAG: NAD(P)/FAD-dependent oxidoreductase [Myxococcota bacterium]